MIPSLMRFFSIFFLLALSACGGGGSGSGTTGFGSGTGPGNGGNSAVPTLTVTLSPSNSISSANPATVTATLLDASGAGVAGQVVTFSAPPELAVTNVPTALTGSNGTAIVVLSPANSTGTGAGQVTASATYGGTVLNASAGFTVQATSVTIDSFTSAVPSLGAYGQTSLTLALSGASVGSPVQITVSSACVTAGKATLSPSSITATTSSVTMQYRDEGCGALYSADSLVATITGTAISSSLSLPIASPAVSSVAFISATPEMIYLKGSGFTEASSLVFQVLDASSNPLPNVDVSLHLLTLTGGVTMEGGTADVVLASDANGDVTVRVNSGTVPTPVRVSATIVSTPGISTVSSNLSVAVGLPSELNFSLSQGTKNIEGWDIDGTPNTYQIIASDRLGNPVPNGTSINFIAEGGQIQPVQQTQLDNNGIARATANFVSSSPRPASGRVTVTAYALGEESFIDLNGNNTYDAGEPFQDLGNVFEDYNFDGSFDLTIDQYIPLNINNSSSCVAPGNPILALDPSIPSEPGTCDGVWSGAGQVYVRRALQTVFSTSAGRPLWASISGLSSNCSKLTMQIGPEASDTANLALVNGSSWYGNGAGGTLNLFVADANPGSPTQGLDPRLNPMAAGTTVSATTPTPGLSVTLGSGSPVPSTTEVSGASIAYNFTDATVNQGVVYINFTSPSGLISGVAVTVYRAAVPDGGCSLN